MCLLCVQYQKDSLMTPKEFAAALMELNQDSQDPHLVSVLEIAANQGDDFYDDMTEEWIKLRLRKD